MASDKNDRAILRDLAEQYRELCESDRNRELTGISRGAASKTDDTFKEMAGAIVDDGLDPAIVADKVMAAIRNKDFWILTHPGWNDVLQERITGMVSNKLVTGFGG